MRLDRIKLITEMAKQEINQKELAKKVRIDTHNIKQHCGW